MRNIRHTLVKNAVRSAMLETARSSSAVHLDEPVVTDYFAAKDPMTKDDTRNRADISAVLKGRTVLLDIVVPHPTVRTNKAVSTTPGTAAADANTRSGSGGRNSSTINCSTFLSDYWFRSPWRLAAAGIRARATLPSAGSSSTWRLVLL